MEVHIPQGSEIVIDTNVLIELIRRNTLEEFVGRVRPHLTNLSLYEYLRGELFIGHEVQERKQTLEEIFHILHLDNKALKKACELWVDLASKRKLIPEPDIWIGTLCITKDLPFLTEDTEHFERLEERGLELIPWKQ